MRLASEDVKKTNYKYIPSLLFGTECYSLLKTALSLDFVVTQFLWNFLGRADIDDNNCKLYSILIFEKRLM